MRGLAMLLQGLMLRPPAKAYGSHTAITLASMKKYLPILYSLALFWTASSCASFERYQSMYNNMLLQSDYEGAAKMIEKKKFFQKERNLVLYYLELGALARMNGDLAKSNEYLNQADRLIEDRRASVGAQGLALVSNPRVLPYRTEYFENVAVHYIKSLNYLQLNQPDAARVEARRTNIRLQELNDAVPDKPLKYRDDVLGHIIMGLSYEMNGEWNNAFIAYRNAANLFIQDERLSTYMGVQMPEQLKCDLVRMADQLGFTNDAQRYSRLLTPRCKEDIGPGGSLVLFWENGQGPIKEENIIGFDIRRSAGQSQVQFVNDRRGMAYDPGPDAYRQYDGFAGLATISIALPAFQLRPYPLRWAQIQYPGGIQKLEMVENLNAIAEQSLRDRFGRELTNALVRLAAKKAVEAGLRTIKTQKSSDEDEDKDETDEEKAKKREEADKRTAADRGQREAPKPAPQKKEEEYDETLGIVLSGAMGIVNMITERADTRSWQTLPAEIHYQRVPLKAGPNEVRVSFFNQFNQRADEHTLRLDGRGRMMVRSLITPQSRVIRPNIQTNQTNQNIRP